MRPGQPFDKGDHRANNPFFSQQSIIKTNAFLEKIKPIANAKGITLAQLALKWTLERPGITIALAGARNETQSVQNAAATTFDLNPDELDSINRELEKI